MTQFLAPSERASILCRIKEGYLIWMSIAPHIPRNARYTMGARIENKFLDLLELSRLTYFSPKEVKPEKISKCILILDSIKFLITVAWEAKLVSNKQLEEITIKLDEIGKMLWGWQDSFKNQEKKPRFINAGKK